MPTVELAAKSVIYRPGSDTLRELTAAMPQARLTKYDNYNVQTRVVARSKGW